MKLEQAFTLFGDSTNLKRKGNPEIKDNINSLKRLKFWADEAQNDYGLTLPNDVVEKVYAEDWEPASPPNSPAAKRAKM